MSLIRTTDELIEYININVNTKFAKLKPSLENAEHNFIKPLLGIEFYNEFNAAYQASPTVPLSPENAALLPYVQKAIASYAAFLSTEELGVEVGDLGIQQHVSLNSQPAPAWKVKDYKMKHLTEGDKRADLLLEFLEYASVIPDGGTEDDRIYKKWYDDPTANTKLAGTIVYKTPIANKYIDILDSRRLFLRLKKRIVEIESGVIKKIICGNQYNELVQQIKSDTVTEANQKLIAMLEPIISKRALYATMPMLPVIITADGLFLQTSNDSVIQKLQAGIQEKETYRTQLKDAEDIGYLADEAKLHQFIKDNISDYPLISESPCWVEDVSDTNDKWKVDNHPCNKHFST